MSRLLRAWFFIFLLALSSIAHALETLTLGVFAYRPKPIIEAHYQPLADYLSEALGDGVKVRLAVLDQDEIDQALSQNQLDLVFTNPAHYLILRSENTLTGVLATLIRLENQQPTNALGGVVITLPQSSLYRLEDLIGQRVAYPGVKMLGGYRVHLYELLQREIEVKQIQLLTKGTHDQVVEAVLSGEVNAGWIRTGVLEALEREGKLQEDQLRVINQQNLPGFPFRVSTRLYPEWPFIALPHVKADTVRQIAAALMNLKADHPAAQAAQIHGFSPPSDYIAVENLARSLRLPPYDAVPEITLDDVWSRYGDWMLIYGLLMLMVSSAIIGLLVQNRRIRLSEEQLRLAAQVFSHAREPILITDHHGVIIDVNEAMCDSTGYSRPEMLGKTPSMLKSGRQPSSYYDEMWRQLRRGKSWSGEVWNRHKDGEVYAVMHNISVVLNSQGKPRHYVAIYTDITALKNQQAVLEHMAHYDALTQLPNRVLLNDRLHQACMQAKRHTWYLAVVYIDLDGFKQVNDTYGHAVGDELLIQVSQRMKEALREVDTLARIGGDEFIALLTDLESPALCEPVLQRLLAAASSPIQIRLKDRHTESVQSLAVSASLGVALYPDDPAETDALNQEALIRAADHAMYDAKHQGKNRFVFYSAVSESERKRIAAETSSDEEADVNR